MERREKNHEGRKEERKRVRGRNSTIHIWQLIIYRTQEIIIFFSFDFIQFSCLFVFFFNFI